MIDPRISVEEFCEKAREEHVLYFQLQDYESSNEGVQVPEDVRLLVCRRTLDMKLEHGAVFTSVSGSITSLGDAEGAVSDIIMRGIDTDLGDVYISGLSGILDRVEEEIQVSVGEVFPYIEAFDDFAHNEERWIGLTDLGKRSRCLVFDASNDYVDSLIQKAFKSSKVKQWRKGESVIKRPLEILEEARRVIVKYDLENSLVSREAEIRKRLFSNGVLDVLNQLENPNGDIGDRRRNRGLRLADSNAKVLGRYDEVAKRFEALIAN